MLRMLKAGRISTNLKINVVRHFKKKLDRMGGNFTSAPLDRKIRELELSLKEDGGRLDYREKN